MNTFFKLVLSGALLNTLACQVKTSGGSDAGGTPSPAPAAPVSEKINDQTLQGQVTGFNWTMGDAVGVMTPDGNLEISIAGPGEQLSCDDHFLRRPGLTVIVPVRVGEYTFNMINPTGNPVTMIFPPNTDHYDTVNTLSDQSTVAIYSIANEKVDGGIFAVSADSHYPFKLNGKFQLYICR